MVAIPQVFRRGGLIPAESAMWVIVSCTVLLFLSVNLPSYAVLAYRGLETQGTIVEKQPDNHSYIRYSYTVDGQTYTASDMSGRGCGNPDFSGARVGAPVRVSYDPRKPQRSLLGDALCRLKDEGSGLIVSWVIFSLMIRVMLWARRYLSS